MGTFATPTRYDSIRTAAARSAASKGIAAQRDRDWNEAGCAWQQYRDLTPHLPLGHVSFAAALCEAGQLDEADAVLQPATTKFPDDIGVATIFAQVATRRLDWEQALARWRRVRVLAPDLAGGFLGESAALLALAQTAEAESILRMGLERCHNDTDLLSGLARVAQRQGRWAEAEERWRLVIHLAPDRAEGYLGSAGACRAQANLPAAHALLRQATRRAGMGKDIIVGRSRTALACGRSLAATCHWDAVAALYHDHPIVREAGSTSRVDLRALLLCFESLGGNCEFGLVQRHMRAEPLCLLRWTAIFPANAARAIADGLKGVGEIAYTEAIVDEAGEYLLRDVRYGMGMHSFVKADDTPIAAFLQKQCARVIFLREKLLESLRNATKIFVYWQPNLTNEQLAAVHAAVRSHGSAKTLGVRVAEPGESSPSVSVVAPGLLLGVIDRDGRLGTRQGWDIAYDQWAAICLQAQILSRAT